MKKIILTLLIAVMVAVLGIGLSACNSATPQGQLHDLLFDYEHEEFEYDVKIYDVKNSTYNSERGTYFARHDKFKKGEEVAFGSRTLSNVSEGIRVTGELIYGDTVYEMGCYYTLTSGTSYMVPAYSFMTVSENGETTYEMQGTYNGGTFECERKFGDGDPQTQSVKMSGTVWDNNQFQQILRALPSSTFSSGLSISFNTPIANAYEFGSATLTASGSSKVFVKDIPYTNVDDDLKENGLECYQISLSRSTEIKKTMTHTLYYAVNDIKWKMKNALVKIVEPFKDDNGQTFETHYLLVSAEEWNE
ncbi:MAG: hypothetical protein NC037_05820 [Bacteroides sp.]|nr:hypothetical protein [Bacillota bacterium]MCM1393942.1 hypothetical protein [[Eubacterium] siraeum]MCM1456023.1 hypothetical protein [Bacteroides sp.]